MVLECVLQMHRVGICQFKRDMLEDMHVHVEEHLNQARWCITSLLLTERQHMCAANAAANRNGQETHYTPGATCGLD
jgi:hypothetical protein